MRVKNTKPLGQVAIELGLLQTDQVEECLTAQQQIADLGCHKRIGEIFVERGLLSSEQLERTVRFQRDSYQQRYFGSYELKNKLGQGGMGTVYRALAKDGREVALKVMSRELSARKQFVDRFEREAAVAASLSHPNLVRTFGAEQLDKRRVLVMEYVEGKPLSTKIRDDERVAEGEALEIARQMGEALGAIHAAGIVHRDVKPGNVLVMPSGQVKLLDMGLAKKVGSSEHSITMTGQLIGTPDFMAPEQFLGKDMDHRVDVYALGATLYAMVTGQAPFAGRENAQAIMMGHLSGSFRDPMDLAPDLSDAAAHIIEKAMAVEAPDRYPDIATMIADIARVAGGSEPATERPTEAQTMVMRQVPRGQRRRRPGGSRGRAGRRRRGRNWAPVAIGGGAIALVLLLAALGSRDGEDTDDPPRNRPKTVVRKDTPDDDPVSPGSGRAPGSAVADAPVTFRDPAWYFTVQLPPRWTTRRPDGRVRLRAEGPASGTLSIAVDDLGTVGLPLVELARAERLMRAANAGVDVDDVPAITMSIGDQTLRGCALRVPGSRNERIYAWYHTGRLLMRVEVGGLPREKAYALLQTLKTDSGRELDVAAPRRERFEDDIVAFDRPEGWQLDRRRPHYYELTRGRARMTLYVGPNAGAIEYMSVAKTRPLKDPRTVEIGDVAGQSTLGTIAASSTYVQRFEAISKGGATTIADVAIPQSAISAADLVTFWRLVASIQPRWKPEPSTAPPAGGLAAVERRLGTTLETITSFRRVRSKVYLGGGVFQVARMASPSGKTLFVSRCTLRDTKETVQQSFETMYLMSGARVGVLSYKRLDGAAQAAYAMGKDSQWVARLGNGAPKGVGRWGVVHGVYDPGNLSDLLIWLVGRDTTAGKRAQLRVLHGPRGEVVTADLEFVAPRSDPGLGIALYVRYVLSSGERGAIGLDARGTLVTVMDGKTLMMPRR